MGDLVPNYDPEALVQEVERVRHRLEAHLADIDPADIVQILQSVLRPPLTGKRYFLRHVAPGVYVP